MAESPTAGRPHRFRGIALPLVFLQNPVSDLRDTVFPEPFETEIPDMRSIRLSQEGRQANDPVSLFVDRRAAVARSFILFLPQD